MTWHRADATSLGVVPRVYPIRDGFRRWLVAEVVA